ncbi:DNA-(apurinic or apyrimidinic site) lyase [Vermiconidia calcicola]|uniref:DNA-(Apurinic or apyrimidinic site) lyase n=1 Tax=Vermiconidia calcicola TaxID=1690605 RepID=A0ACC3NWX1_9PEZI|nr:DNA-(apurinic or apyrimidinic site) lyase [Vermiconidia calcicola]
MARARYLHKRVIVLVFKFSVPCQDCKVLAMPKKKAVRKVVEEDSDLSPPPDDLLKEEPAANGVSAKTTKKSRKRKVQVEDDLDEEPKVKSTRAKKQKVQVKEEETAETVAKVKGGRKRKVEVKTEEAVETGVKPKKGKKHKAEVESEDTGEVRGEDNTVEKKPRRKRKTKEEKEAEAMPIAARTIGHKLLIGAHVSSAGGVHNSVVNCVHIGGNAFALFLKSQRKWANPPLADEHCTSFHANCKSHSYDQAQHVIPHGSYLVNLAHTDGERTKQAYEAFLDDLKRCERLGIKLYNFHPGAANSTKGDRQAAIAHLASNVNRAHSETSTVVTLLENMAAGGNILGSTLEDLRDIIALTDNKDRVGVCLDTCHAFAAGYDLRTPEAYEATMKTFEETVGFKYLRAVHMNDSKAPYDSHRDLHANIGTGFLGLRAFHNIVNDSRFQGLPIVLETPIEAKDENGVPLKDEKGKEKEDKGIWAREIKLLESLVGMDVESDEFSILEKELAKKGESERNRLTEQIDRKRNRLTEQIDRKREKDEKKAKSSRKKKGQQKEELNGDSADEGSPLR